MFSLVILVLTNIKQITDNSSQEPTLKTKNMEDTTDDSPPNHS